MQNEHDSRCPLCGDVASCNTVCMQCAIGVFLDNEEWLLDVAYDNGALDVYLDAGKEEEVCLF